MGQAGDVLARLRRTHSRRANDGAAGGSSRLMRELHCPICGGSFVRVTYRDGMLERLLGRVNVFPFRCQLCTNRFRAYCAGARDNTQVFDRRQYTRLPASIEVQVLDSNQSTNRITDISMDGCNLADDGILEGGLYRIALEAHRGARRDLYRDGDGLFRSPVLDRHSFPGGPTGSLPSAGPGGARALSRSRS